MLKLYQFAPIENLPNASPFCMKLEMYLRLAKIPYEIVITPRPSQAPKGKLPFIEDNGKTIGDSKFIIAYLKKQYGDPLDGHLTNEQQALALAIQCLLEEHFYWIAVYSRWIDPAGWAATKPRFFNKSPLLLKLILPSMIRRYMKKQLHAQGMGRHTQEEIYQMGREDISALAALLGEKPFMLGNEVSSIDAAIYATLANILVLNSLFKPTVESFPNLMAYYERMKQKW
jgi:glutathione S-transferase